MCWLPSARPGTVDDHRVVEQRAVALLRRLQLRHPGGELLHVVPVDLRHLVHLLHDVPVVRERMMAVGDADLAVGA